ncbi:GntR family transcriptional regulator [Candidimonas nitroreducens]|uniref:GntR family transcriptional regulator n=1 Tax=Candidimonas nitroreducens TaxID=683354 RepID=A0A225M8E9_9BURK|nr:FCD domain-containing protein [Candidimonas nitroreducens]OWT55229.1 GntR family transcriptional regulator [Candidimonas nitroreducens]
MSEARGAAAQAGPEPGGRTQASILEQALRQDLINGRFEAGAKLRLKDLSARYGAGVIPLREALSRLCASGFVVAVDQKGFRVAELSKDDLRDITLARQQIESLALREAIARADPQWEGEVVAALHRIRRMAITVPGQDRQMSPDWENAHTEFHATLLKGCGSVWLQRFSTQLRDQTSRYRYLSLAVARPERGSEVRTEHQAIVDAILAGDADQACELLTRHYQTTADLLLAHMGAARPAT